MQVRRLVEILDDCGSCLPGLFVRAVRGQMWQQFLQRLKLLANTVVAVFQHGDGLVEAGGAVGQGVHGGLFRWLPG